MVFVKQLKVLNCGVSSRSRILGPDSLGIRLFSTPAAVRRRTWRKRVGDLEDVAQRDKITSKNLFVFDILKREFEHVIPVWDLDSYRRDINIHEPYTITQFLQKSPKLFELYKDHTGIPWCGLTPAAERLIKEEKKVIAQNSDKAAEYVTRMLMMSVDKRLPLRKISKIRRDLGLPNYYRRKWVNSYPELFKVVKPFTPVDEEEYLELVSWRQDWAITELEKTQRGITDEYDNSDHVPGLLRLAFPMKFPHVYNRTLFRHRGKIHHFQMCEYLCPYADPKGLRAGSREFDKRAVAIMHELLSFTTEKRLAARKFSYFRREFVMPQKELRLLMKYLGIFYVSQRGRKFSAFLNEAYEGSELIEKHPLVIWKENFEKLVNYGGKSWQIETDEDGEDKDILGNKSEDGNGMVETEGDRNCTSKLEEEASIADFKMEIDEIHMECKNRS